MAEGSGHSSPLAGGRQVRLDLVCLFSQRANYVTPTTLLARHSLPSYKLPPALELLPLLHSRPPLTLYPRLQFIYRY
jgi:hypothetical protein